MRCRRCRDARCFESVPTWPPFPQTGYAVLGSAASCHSLLDALLDTRRRSVRIAHRLRQPPSSKKTKQQEKKPKKKMTTLDMAILSDVQCVDWLDVDTRAVPHDM